MISLYSIGVLSYFLGCSGEIKSSVGDTYYGDIPFEEEQDWEDTSSYEQEESYEDFVYVGPYETVVTNRSTSVTGCIMNYDVYTPLSVDNPQVVVLAHGFARGSETMTGWASHLSSWGVEVLLPTLCHYNVLLGVDHVMNGENMVELGQHHGADAVIYAGHSAGGLAAIIAASLDSNDLGVLGLDVTDTTGIPGVPDLIGQQYASGVTGSGFSIRGEPSSCNAEGNGLDLFEMMGNSYKVKVAEADHCDFEYPTNFGCELNCENSNASVPDEAIRSEIIILGTSAILSLAGLSDDGWILWLGTH